MQVDTQNGKSGVVERLRLTRNNGYMLILDAKGAEAARFIDDAGENGATGDEPMVKIKHRQVLDAMLETREGKRKGLTGTALVRRLLTDARRDIVMEGTWLVAASLGKTEPLVAPLIALLDRRDGHKRPSLAWGAASALGRLGTVATPAADALAALADNEDASISERQMALISLGSLDPKAPAVLPALRRGIDASQLLVVGAAIAAEKLGPRAASLHSALVARYDATEKGSAAYGYLARAVAATRPSPARNKTK